MVFKTQVNVFRWDGCDIWPPGVTSGRRAILGAGTALPTGRADLNHDHGRNGHLARDTCNLQRPLALRGKPLRTKYSEGLCLFRLFYGFIPLNRLGLISSVKNEKRRWPDFVGCGRVAGGMNETNPSRSREIEMADVVGGRWRCENARASCSSRH